jgi:hypothetical protein
MKKFRSTCVGEACIKGRELNVSKYEVSMVSRANKLLLIDWLGCRIQDAW